VSSGSFELGANVENLTLLGSGWGWGNELDNVITGSTGNDTLDGVSGSDTLIGGLGNDTYIVTGADDTVIENPGAGVDTVVSSGSFRLGDNVENLILTGSGTGTGNGLDNVITGSIGDDFLSGGYGGAGDEDIALGDTLNGGRGNDTLLGDEMFTKGGNDVLNGGAGNDILDAGRSRGRQFDTLTGGTEADIFALGLNDSGLPFITDYYLGDGHATITDFSVSAGDKINVHGSSSDYTLTLGNTGGNDAAQDTLIELNGDLIGIVLDVDLTNSAGQVFI
jgi:Ca2+-binding RTX toxin-like protein